MRTSGPRTDGVQPDVFRERLWQRTLRCAALPHSQVGRLGTVRDPRRFTTARPSSDPPLQACTAGADCPQVRVGVAGLAGLDCRCPVCTTMRSAQPTSKTTTPERCRETPISFQAGRWRLLCERCTGAMRDRRNATDGNTRKSTRRAGRRQTGTKNTHKHKTKDTR